MASGGDAAAKQATEEDEQPVEMLEPGKNIKPIMTPDQAKELVLKLFGLKVRK